MQDGKTEASPKLKIPALVGAICCALMIAALFLPYGTATEGTAAYYQAFSDITVSELGTTADQLENISLVEFARIYSTLWNDQGAVYMAIAIASGVLSGLALLCFLGKKPIPAILLTALTLGIFLLENGDYTSRGVIPSDHYTWGIGYYLMFAALAGAFVAGVVLFIQKRRAKKATAQDPSSQEG